MTVWVVTLNGLVQSIALTEAGAAAAVERIKRGKYRTEAWRQVGAMGWASRTVTNLRYQPMECDET